MSRAMAAGILLCLLLGAVFAASTVAPKNGTDIITIPQLINYQGKLTDNAGNPMPGPTYDMTFEIWDASSSGGLLWTETQLAVPVTNGLFSVLLGSVGVAPVIPDEGVAWLQVNVGATPIDQRIQLVSAPYAYSAAAAEYANDADKLDGNHAAAFALTGHDHSPTGGDVTGSANGILTIGNSKVTLPKLDATGASSGQAIYYNGAAIAWGNPTAGAHVHNGADITSGTVADARLSSNVVLLNAAQTITATKTFSAQQAFTYGGAPFTVSNATAVTNLNADLLDGNHSSAFAASAHNHTVATGGTGLTSLAAGALAYGSGGTTMNVLNPGTSGYYLYTSGSSLSWQPVSASNYWTNSGSGYIYPNTVSNSGVRAYGTGYTYNLYAQTNSTSQSAVYGYNASCATYGALGNYTPYAGVYGYSPTSGAGYYGVYGAVSYSTCYAVYGYNLATYVYGALGCNLTGYPEGVYGSGGTNGYCGIFGYAQGTNGLPYSAAVYGVTAGGPWGALGSYGAATYCGVYGYGTSSYPGGYFASYTGNAVTGVNTGYGTQGYLGYGSTAGVYGYNSYSGGRGVYGYATYTSGVCYGLYGYGYGRDYTYGAYSYGYANQSTSTAYSVYGSTSLAISAYYGGSYGVYGYAQTGYSGYGNCFGGYFYANGPTTNSSSGYFSYGVYAYGYAPNSNTGTYGMYSYAYNGSGATYLYPVYARNGYNNYYTSLGYSTYKAYGTGTASCYVIDNLDMERTLHCPENPEVLFEDVGSNHLVSGYCRVNIDPLLLDNIVINAENPLRVFVTPTGDQPVALSITKGASYFEVHGPAGSSVAFDWRLVANRKGFENMRFEAHERPEDLKGTKTKLPTELSPDLKKTPYTQ